VHVAANYFLLLVGFYACGYRTIDEAMECTTIWATSLREGFENWIAMDDRPSKTHPEVVATKHMNEDEEWNYIYERYIQEPEEGQQDAQQENTLNDTK
jgi:hypothetical protein